VADDALATATAEAAAHGRQLLGGDRHAEALYRAQSAMSQQEALARERTRPYGLPAGQQARTVPPIVR
jgi:hypothetical protein